VGQTKLPKATFPGPLGPDNWYHYVAFPTDENGNPVIPYVAPAGGWGTLAQQTPYDNGGWQIVVLSGAGVVNVQPENLPSPPFGTNQSGTLGPFLAPNPHQMPSTNWWDGEGFKFQCVTTGTAVIAMKMVDGSLSAGKVAGFTYNSGNYPAAGALLGSTGADLYYGNGNGMTVNCTGNTVLSIN
jgi:hypothetical protein